MLSDGVHLRAVCGVSADVDVLADVEMGVVLAVSSILNSSVKRTS